MTVEAEREYWRQAAQAEDPVFEMMAEKDHGSHTVQHVARIQGALDITDGDVVLELGCGVGRLISLLAANSESANFVGVDISEELIALAPVVNNIVYIVNDGRVLPVKGFNKAYSMVVLQHIDKQAAAAYVTQIAQALPIGGVFYFQFINGVGDSFLNRHFSFGEMVQVCNDAGLTVTDCENDDYSEDWVWLRCVK